MRHHLVRSIASSLLNEVCEDMTIEPQLQSLTGESFAPSTAKVNEARHDISCARGF